MPFHFCHEELLAILAAVPMLRMIVPYLRAKWHNFRGKCDHEDQRDDSTPADGGSTGDS